ncbi:preprotein translocase subunit SecY [Isoalcanivorax pacificus W11-5]|uniref:Protein translocase subunit SecY n=1 Tax=Isoalcanivorax pacificus W11-5 TaxID=391936 RepID=A0A0B4XK23_9GAMM|nr:preprotein translocase subunit SecY [Isoalcanivorax pacificus]AJD47010.1 preprotein translocase subunit SecY [Isoalcanivorax pacificus W11-5]
MAKNRAQTLSQNTPDGSALRGLWRRIGFLLGALVVFRIGAHIPVPGINPDAMARLFDQNRDTVLAMFNMFSGGALERMSIFALGVMPYITASIVIQLLSAVNPTLEQLRKEGEQGRRKITQYTRYLTVFLALIQSFGVAAGLYSQNVTLVPENPATMDIFSFYFVAVTSLVTGTIFLMWLGEQITERGIGNGISMLIFAGIVAGLPGAVAQTFEATRQGEMNLMILLAVLVVAVAVIFAVVFFERGQRRITVNYARRQQGRRMYAAQQSHLPLKVNMAGVIPAIFASSILLFPASISQWFAGSSDTWWANAMRITTDALMPGSPLYILLFTLGIVFFCYFYAALMFNPKDVADNLKKSGAYIPGIRPGEQSARYIDTVMGRLTLVGAAYMTAVCLLPLFLQGMWNVPFYLGGTSLLIVVVVVMDFWAQVNAQLMSTQYEKLMKKANLKGYGGTGLVR